MTLKKYFTIVYLVFCTHQGGQAAEDLILHETPIDLSVLLETFVVEAMPLCEKLLNRASFATRESTEILLADIEEFTQRNMAFDYSSPELQVSTGLSAIESEIARAERYLDSHQSECKRIEINQKLKAEIKRFWSKSDIFEMPKFSYDYPAHLNINAQYLVHPLVWDAFRFRLTCGFLCNLNARIKECYKNAHLITDPYFPLADIEPGLYLKTACEDESQIETQKVLFSKLNVANHNEELSFWSFYNGANFLKILLRNEIREDATREITKIIIESQSAHIKGERRDCNDRSENYYAVLF